MSAIVFTTWSAVASRFCSFASQILFASLFVFASLILLANLVELHAQSPIPPGRESSAATDPGLNQPTLDRRATNDRVSDQGPDLLALEDDAIRQAVAVVGPSVVRIETLGGTEMVENRLIGGGPTTGLIIAADGWILSSSFGFANRPASILVDLPVGGRRPAKIVARDEPRRLVLLKVEMAGEERLPVPSFVGRAGLQVGQRTIALGRTFAPEHPNVSVGLLSALYRVYGRAVQTDAKVSPSNYGGPLITLDGQVIGILVPLSPDHGQDSSSLAGSEWYDSGVGFAVPLDSVFRRLPDLQQGQSLLAGRLGVGLETGYRFTQIPQVKRVIPETPLARAGVQPGDIFTSVNDQPVATLMQFQTAMGVWYAGDRVRLGVKRDQQTLTFEVDLMAQLPPMAQAYLGILPEATTTDDARVEKRDAADTTEAKGSGTLTDPKGAGSGVGVSVRYVFADSPARQMGLQVGDRITHLQDKPVTDARALRAALEGFFPKETVGLRYQRGTETLSATFAVAERSARIANDVPPRNRRAADSGDEPRSKPQPANPPADTPLPADTAPPAGDVQGARGVVSIQTTDEDFVCKAYLPRQWSSQDATSLLVVIPTPGTVMPEDELLKWQETCEQLGIVALLPLPTRADRWLPGEADRIVRAVQAVSRLQRIDSQRVAAFGREGGGSMAFLLAFRGIKLFRGVAAIDAVPPVTVDLPENEPGRRLSVWLAQRTGSPLASRLHEVITTLQERRFPLHLHDTETSDLDAAQRNDVAQWLDQLDQL